MARAAGLTGPCLPQEASAHICANGWIRVIWSTDAPPIATETKRPLCTAYPGTGRADRRHSDRDLRDHPTTKAVVRRRRSTCAEYQAVSHVADNARVRAELTIRHKPGDFLALLSQQLPADDRNCLSRSLLFASSAVWQANVAFATETPHWRLVIYSDGADQWQMVVEPVHGDLKEGMRQRLADCAAVY